MPEQPQNSILDYQQLVMRQAELVSLKQIAVDDRVAETIASGLQVIEEKIKHFTTDPEFAGVVLTELDKTATALEQLSSVEDLLPAEDLLATAKPYREIALRGLEIAASLRLTGTDQEKFITLKSKLGSFLVLQEAADNTEVKDEEEAPPAQTERDPLDTTDKVVQSPEAFLAEHFPRKHALVLVRFLNAATGLIRAQQIPSLPAERLHELATLITQETAQEEEILSGEDEQQERTTIIRKITELLENEEHLARVIDSLPEYSPRLELLNYLYIELDETQRGALRHLAKAHPTLLDRIEDKQEKAGKGLPTVKDIEVTSAQNPADTELAPEDLPQQAELDEQKEKFLEDSQKLIKEIVTDWYSKFDRNETYTPNEIAKQLRVPYANIMKAILKAKKEEIFGPSKKLDKFNLAEFLLLQLYNDQGIASYAREHKDEVHALIQSALSPDKK